MSTPILECLAGRLSDRGVASTTGLNGWTVWQGFMPDATDIPDRAVALVEGGGAMRIWGPNLTDARIDALVRGAPIAQVTTAYAEAQAEAQAVKRAFDGLVGTALSGRQITAIIAEQEPYFAGEDETQRPWLNCTYRVLLEATTS